MEEGQQNMKLCIDCAFCHQHLVEADEVVYYCIRENPMVKSPVTGEHILNPGWASASPAICLVSRMGDTFRDCGLEGRWFAEKSKPNVEPSKDIPTTPYGVTGTVRPLDSSEKKSLPAGGLPHWLD